MKKIILTIAFVTISTSAFAGAPNSSAGNLDTKEARQISAQEENINLHKEGNLDAEKNEVSFSCTEQNVAQ
jgi:hypothetical protein